MNEEERQRLRRPHNDNRRPDEPAIAVPKRQIVDDFLMGIRFFSRLPSGDRPHEKPDLTRIAMALPFASLVVGVAPTAVLLGASLIGLPKLFAAGLAIAVAIVVTGAMAEDAIADAADGLFGGSTRERRLEIMKDSRHGTYGVAALCLSLLLRAAALAALAEIQPVAAAAVWLAATLMARSASMWLTVALPPARPDGLSASVGRVTRPGFFMGALFAVILGVVLAAPSAGLAGLAFVVVLIAAVTWAWSDLCRRLVGGQTGDLIGALHAILEIAALGAFLLFI
jgi:adenosylcobinamide-GDP ribazoletransferase